VRAKTTRRYVVVQPPVGFQPKANSIHNVRVSRVQQDVDDPNHITIYLELMVPISAEVASQSAKAIERLGDSAPLALKMLWGALLR
jgi:hypothetical protein